MKQLNQMMLGLYLAVTNGWNEFKSSDRGDTNFVSILLIIAIVVVLAGLFLTLGKTVMETVSGYVTNFLDGLGL
ncbi:MAG: hypothetical protein LUF28_07945 [Clostridiales bacterium]|nr:hypothetical protein [Clostridiales bacterium]